MGYTHYWRQRADLNQTQWQRYLEKVRTLLDHLPAHTDSAGGHYVDAPLGLVGNSDNGEHSPHLDGEIIFLNGDGEHRDGTYLSHEDFVLTRRRRDLYDYEIREGKTKDGPRGEFCKTARKPYDLVVSALLIVLENDFPEVFSVESDGEPSEWQPALDWVNATLRDKAYEHPAGVVPVRASTRIME